MDLLGSILNSMDKPPTATEQNKELIKKRKEQLEKYKNNEKDQLNKFRRYVEERIQRFVKDERNCLQFQPFEKVYRSIIHDVSEVAGLLALSFGQEGIDRYMVVYKREYPPTEDEVMARKNGEEWNSETAKKYALRKEEKKELDNQRNETCVKKEAIPNTNYKEKYEHLIGKEAALDAARKTESNKSYGFVPSSNKKDIRSIEQTMADIQAKKRLKTYHLTNTPENTK